MSPSDHYELLGILHDFDLDDDSLVVDTVARDADLGAAVDIPRPAAVHPLAAVLTAADAAHRFDWKATDARSTAIAFVALLVLPLTARGFNVALNF